MPSIQRLSRGVRLAIALAAMSSLHAATSHTSDPAPRCSEPRVVEGLDGLAASLVGRGATMISDGVIEWPDGRRSCLLRDPDGHAVRLVEHRAG